MSAEIAWYVGCPLLAAGLSVAAVRRTRSRTAVIAPASEEEELPLEMAGVAHEPLAEARPGSGEETAAVVPATGTEDGFLTARREKKGALARVMRRGVAAVVRHAARTPPATEIDLAGDPRDDGARRAAPAVPAGGVVADAHSEAIVSSLGQPDPLCAGATEATRGHGIVEFDEPTGEDVQGGGPDWATTVATREAALAQSLRAREDAERLAREREDNAAALRHQEELERIAVAEQARVRAQARARARRWFARLDADLDAPTVAERAALVTTLEIRAPWAGKLLREAFAQEEEPQVRARIVGALVAGDHLEVREPFELAFARGGIERAAVWETLRPRLDEAAWIAEVLAPLLDAMAAA